MVPSTVKNVRNIIIAKGISAQYNTSMVPLRSTSVRVHLSVAREAS